MIYTIGETESHDRHLAMGGTVRLLGRTDPNRGGLGPGSVWKTPEDAKAYLDEYPRAHKGHSVYGVLAEWDSQTAPSADRTYQELLVSSDLVKLSAEA
jgi:hypothetical protein